VHGGLLGLRVEPGLRVGQAVASEHDLLSDQQRLPVPLDVVLVAEGDFAARRGGEQIGRHLLLVHHPDLEARGAAEDVLRLRGVLYARQLDDDTVGALLLDHRFGAGCGAW